MKNFTISNFKTILKNVSKLSTLSFNIISNQVEFILFIISINFKKKKYLITIIDKMPSIKIIIIIT